MRLLVAAVLIAGSGTAEAGPKVIALPDEGVVISRPAWFRPGPPADRREAQPLPDRPRATPGGPRVIRVPDSDPGGSGPRG